MPLSSPKRKILPALKKLLAEPALTFLENLAKTFPDAEVFLVGGAVRDMIIGRETKDDDFVVRNVPAEKLERFLKKHGHVDFVGKVFGVFKFFPKDHGTFEPFDIALPRTEHVHVGIGAYKDFDVQSDPTLPIERDLERRDFTMNAIAVRIPNGEIVDPGNGLRDIAKKRIVTVGAPDLRFSEDHSRILRALRFACQLGFKIEKTAWEELVRLVEGEALTRQREGEWIVPRETIGKEFVKAFFEHPTKAFDLFEESGVFRSLIPEIGNMKGCPQPLPWHSEGDVFTHTKMALAVIGSKLWKKYFGDKRPNALTIITILLHDIAKPPCLRTPEAHGTDRIRFDEHEPEGARIASEICDRLKLSSWPNDSPLHVDREKLAWLIGHHLLLLHADPPNMRHTTIERYFFRAENPGQELLELSLCDTGATIHKDTGKPYLSSLDAMLERIRELETLKKEQARLPASLLNGHDVMKILGWKPGPEVGIILEELREQQLSGKIRTKKQAETYLKKSTPHDPNDPRGNS